VLTQLNIRNLAVVDAVDLEFGAGYTALTGETGAGKSILVDALALALGARADSKAVRSDSERCEIAAAFELDGRPDLLDWLRANDFDEDGECVLRRIVTADGRSRGYVNGRPVPMQTLREFGERLVDICGQQSHQSLRHAHVQREILDQFGDHRALAQKMRDAFDAWSAARAEYETLRDALDDREARIELLQHQVRELDALNPQPGEFAELERLHRLSANSARVAECGMRALEQVYEGDDGSAHALLSDARRTLDEAAEFDPELADAAALLGEAEILLTEAAGVLRQRLAGAEHDPAEEARLEQRLSGFHDLARKHRVAPDLLPDLAARLAGDLDGLESGDERVAALEQRTAQCERELRDIAARLTAARRQAAAALAARVTDNMRTLGMPHGRFEIEVRPAAGDHLGAHGADRVEFVTAVNPGQAAGPLNSVASGGELSRISLALQVAARAAEAVPTLIFDEIDAGVGGGVAEIVGTRLRDLAQRRQVLCVTHLPQVASQAHRHLRVSKTSDGRSTRTQVSALDAAERIEEVARMLGGVEITARTRAHAEEMLQAGP
jgi:DNA repair protein RecN (Recombination protein N)